MKSTRVVAIHQPNFLPWFGFFHKMTCADVFVLLDTVPYSKNSYQNRVKMKMPQGASWLTVPVLTKGRFGQLTSEVEIKDSIGWRKTHMLTLTNSYRRAPFFDQTMAWLERVYEQSTILLAQFNQQAIQEMVDQLGLETELVLASELAASGRGSQHLLELVQQVGGDVYLSGASGRQYLDETIFVQAGIQIRYQEFEYPSYPQQHGAFVRGLSMVDLLMNVGPQEARRYLEAASVTEEGIAGPAESRSVNGSTVNGSTVNDSGQAANPQLAAKV